ncbi:MAG: heavy-metal-associated domain-containing protein [Gammaproteobacteria bacterium]|nr:heavy-metal-associated domain-containing protein [Gammaproteobacteria bacterium]
MMSQEKFTVQNVKCGGCSSAIETGLGEKAGVSSVAVVIESGEVTVDGDALSRDELSSKLAELGYPEA